MIRAIRGVAAATAVALVLVAGTPAAQKTGGILRMYSLDSPPGLNIHEQATPFGQGPLMGVFNNLIVACHQPPCHARGQITSHVRRDN